MLTNPVIEAIANRRSIRAYTAEPVSAEELDTIVQCGILAPSARNLQPWLFATVTDKALMDRISQMTCAARNDDFHVFYHAPAIIVISGVTESRWAPTDCGIAIENMCLAAHSLGLGTCIIGMVRDTLNDPELRAALKVPDDHTPIMALAVGHPADAPAAKPREQKTLQI